MWYSLGKFILKYRLAALLLLLALTSVMGFFASKVKLSYDFTKAVPTDNPKFKEFRNFTKKFGADGNTMVVGMQTDLFFEKDFFNGVGELHHRLKSIPGVIGILSIPETVALANDSVTGKFGPVKLFQYPYNNQADLDAARAKFEGLPFYKTLLYNPKTHAYLMGVSLNKDSINSKSRTRLINNILQEVAAFETKYKIEAYKSGMPYIRTVMANRVKEEMNKFLIASFLLSALTLFLFFRSVSSVIMSLLVVGMGVVWSLGTLVLFGYEITLLTALIPILVVVIGIPNCIYFLNKYHTTYKEIPDKDKALVTMVGRMGIVTLFCNIAAAIGFAVFAFTKSALLKEFGVVAGINIMALFLISLLFIPSVLSYLPSPKPKHVRYLDNKYLEYILVKIERWAFHHAKWVYGITAIITVLAVMGILRIKSEGFIVDDLPKKDKLYTDLKWFETQFNGLMPLEILVDTKKPRAALKMTTVLDMEEFSNYISTKSEVARPLSIVEALKFANQGFYGGDSASYALPLEIPASLSTALRSKEKGKSDFMKLIGQFLDSNQQVTRISVNMKDIGSIKLPVLIADLENKSAQIFDSTKYHVSFTGSSVTFLEGTAFIIRGLKESIFWAFFLITLCMLYLFKSFRILICSLIPNLVPLIITAGVMGWTGISLKPSTVLVFSVALGIAIDVTIRFLINYKQELPHFNNQVTGTLVQTIRHTGISIIYTSLVLIAGFIIFCWSDFGGTFALGWLTSLTLVVGTLTNLILLPVLIISTSAKKEK
ncbi:MAG: MMPL family transporter [Chitinophagaceae bacterium]|nr:MMPL family transporter [Chitinophagaceae bacterium]